MITISPKTFAKVHYEHQEIIDVANDVIGRIDRLPADLSVAIEINEDAPTTRLKITSLDPVVFAMEGGAFEDTRKPQYFGAEMASNSLGAILFEYLDRTDPAFGAPPVGEPTDFALKAAWSAYCFGRVSRLGIRVYRPKHRYNYRNRLGFSDTADADFERLWAAEGLTWADIVAVCPTADA